MKLKVVLAWMTVLTLAITACSSPTNGDTGDGPFTAPAPPDEWASGLTIGYIPEGFTFVSNQGHETATFHVFMTADESQQVAIGRQISPPPYPTAGQAVTRAGRDFTVVEDTAETRILEKVGNGIRIEVASPSLDSETLLRIAESTSYDPANDR
jgi:hypothetical protein